MVLTTIIYCPKITWLFIFEDRQENELQRFWQVLDLSESTFIQGASFGNVETFAMVKLAEAMDLNTKAVEPMLNMKIKFFSSGSL